MKPPLVVKFWESTFRIAELYCDGLSLSEVQEAEKERWKLKDKERRERARDANLKRAQQTFRSHRVPGTLVSDLVDV